MESTGVPPVPSGESPAPPIFQTGSKKKEIPKLIAKWNEKFKTITGRLQLWSYELNLNKMGCSGVVVCVRTLRLGVGSGRLGSF
jgi:hypothetical protein